MSSCVIWIDSKHAKIFKLSPEGIVKKELSHHEVPPIGKSHDNYINNAEEHFFHEVTQSLGQPDELLVYGAGVAKLHFRNHLEKHNHKKLFEALVGVETLDSVTDNQILAASRAFFKKHHGYIFKI